MPKPERSSFRATVARWQREWMAVSDAALRINLDHLSKASWLMVLLNLGHVAYFGLWFEAVHPLRSAWASNVAQAHALMVLPMLGVWAVAHQSRKQERPSQLARILPELTACVVLAWAIHLTWLDQAVSSAISAYVNACAAMAILLLLRPPYAALLYSVAWAWMAWGLGSIVSEPDTLANARVNAASASLLSFWVSVLLWRRFVQTELLQRALADTNRRLERNQVQLETLATTDALTGLLNRRALWDRARVELARAQRENTPLSLLVLDLDHFKQVNDRWGHLAGDAVLRHVTALMQGAVRRTDVVGRLGGEEFVVLLPQEGTESGTRLAEKLRHLIADNPMAWDNAELINTAVGTPNLPIRVSIGGVSLLPGEKGSMEELLDMADKALYRAKASGRNKVVWATQTDTLLRP
ncbi:GGDEF domain-containing protein [Hydrogenophaga sp.]|uniref:GGDEF domain-containing protein n=1 Tax=Hydrogenophaga sp. TaxID=1904254 RepID=UPI002AC933F0|nr:GGDEF domain-containing protein [Hydrogenophaga sp.]